ncbi:DNA polymerase alpha subunit B isoform X1 [Aquila chrysaetos chrysaetos]|uniref:DNA polymerase alpha subunit B isoform X1 n=1 Tax=Aquila chrysaetos chrysaetos TaxID=223781 RepID=UPI001B7D40B7|nr:DNA polymerase alpha subunit B isoform X1 [Aquila chrysaetos chrysaetos]
MGRWKVCGMAGGPLVGFGVHWGGSPNPINPFLPTVVELCLTHGLDPEALANELLAFVTSKNLGTQLSADGLDTFEHEVLTKRSSRYHQKRDNRYGGLHDIYSLQELLDEEEDDELLDTYTTPSKGSQKRSNSTPENPRPKRTLSSRSPYALFSPNTLSPSVTPSQKYTARSSRGEVVASFGSVQGPSWSGRGGRSCTPKLFGSPEENLTKSYKFMFQKALDVREVLSWRIEELGDVLKSHHHLEDFASVLLPAQEPVTVLGQIGCDSNGKLNAKSVVLEGDREHSSGRQVPLDLSELKEYSLFPGQIVALEGTNSTGRKMVVSKLYEGVPLPFHTPPEPAPEQRMVLVACGPYTTSDSIAYDPLADLVEVIVRDRPDVCVLFGPFLDAKHEQVENCQLLGSFAEVFKLCLKTIIEGTRSAGSQLVFVPSLRDVHHDYVYPQPPFLYPELPKDDKPRVHFVSDPCTLDVDGVVFGLTSTDLLFHMGAEEISSSSGISDRFTRILKHILMQRSYYPLYPPSEELNVDYETFYSYASLPVTPDVLITPSELRYFVKDVLGCVCINPGRLTKGQVGGTYARLYIQREDATGERRSPCVAAQVVKI